MRGMPAPRSVRATNVSPSRRAPVPAAIRAAASSDDRRITDPPSKRATGSPERSTLMTCSMASASTVARARSASAAAGVAPSLHDTSAGRISVATWPGGAVASNTASAVTRHRSAVCSGRPIHGDTLRAAVSMSDASGASKRAW